MKGIVFTEFLEFVAGAAGEDMVDDLLDECALPSGGIYTSVGTYDHREILVLLEAYCARTGASAATVLTAFGICLAQRFAVLYPEFFIARTTLFSFLESVDHHIHVEVLKLYPDAQLPEFSTVIDGEGRMLMQYRSERHFDLLAEGLIRGAALYYDTEIDILRSSKHDTDGVYTEFTITAPGNDGGQVAA